MFYILKKSIKFILILLLIIVLVALFFVYKNYFKEEEVTTKPLPREALAVYIDGKKLDKERDNFIYSSILRPEFSIFVSEDVEKESIDFQIDRSRNVLKDEFYGEIEWNEKERRFIFRPSYMLEPQQHQLVVGYKDLSGNLISVNFDFVLVFQENFDKPLEDSSVWIIPEDRSSEWFRVESGKLLSEPVTEDDRSSLAFLYPFDNSIMIDFELIPKGDNVSLLFYFLGSRTFVIGNNNNNRMTLLRGGENSLEGKSFELTANHRYHVRIVRTECNYQLIIKELSEEEMVNPKTDFSSEDILIDYTDCSQKPDRIGFSLWSKSDGVLLDNIFITGFSTYKYEE